MDWDAWSRESGGFDSCAGRPAIAGTARSTKRSAKTEQVRAYVEGVASRFGVLDKIRTGTEVQSAGWDEERGRWDLETSAGPYEADILLTACGQLSVPKLPAVPGLEDFAGPA